MSDFFTELAAARAAKSPANGPPEGASEPLTGPQSSQAGKDTSPEERAARRPQSEEVVVEKLGRSVPITREDVLEWVVLYEEGFTAAEIADYAGRGEVTVGRYLRDEGVEIRGRGGRPTETDEIKERIERGDLTPSERRIAAALDQIVLEDRDQPEYPRRVRMPHVGRRTRRSYHPMSERQRYMDHLAKYSGHNRIIRRMLVNSGLMRPGVLHRSNYNPL